MVKKISLLVILSSVAAYGFLQAQTLDEAIKNAASDISNKLQNGSIVAVIAFQSQSARLTDYVIDELNTALVNIGKLNPVDRRRLDVVQNEQNFNMSGAVSDESAQSIGRMLGAQSIVTGSIEIIGSLYKIRFNTITTETAAIQYAFSTNIRNDSVLESLLQGTNYLMDFTTDQRLKASVLNAVFGLGSFLIENDTRGGKITATVEGIGTVLWVTGIAIGIDDYFGAASFYVGLVTYFSGLVYGIIRTQTYHKPGSQMGSLLPEGLGITLVSSQNDNLGLNVSYTWKF